MAAKPISPKELERKLPNKIPDAVIDAVNELILEKWRGNEAVVLQKEIVSRAKKLGHTVNFEKGEMDIEKTFAKAGWKVEYDSPAYCEDFDASFTFSKK